MSAPPLPELQKNYPDEWDEVLQQLADQFSRGHSEKVTAFLKHLSLKSAAASRAGTNGDYRDIARYMMARAERGAGGPQPLCA